MIAAEMSIGQMTLDEMTYCRKFLTERLKKPSFPNGENNPINNIITTIIRQDTL